MWRRRARDQKWSPNPSIIETINHPGEGLWGANRETGRTKAGFVFFI